MLWLDSNSIIEVDDVDSLDEHIGSGWVDSIGVQWEGDEVECADTVIALSKELSEDPLANHISLDGEVMEPEVVNITHVDVVLWGVHPGDSSKLNILRVVHLNEMWSSTWVVLDVLTHPPHESLSVDGSLTLELNVLSMVELHEVGDPAHIPVV